MNALRSLPISVLLVLALPLTAHAQSDSDREQAARLFQLGQDAFTAGSFDEAAISFQEAFNLDPHPVLLFNLARAHEEMLDLPAALAFFRQVLTMSPSDAVRQAARDKIAEVEDTLREQGYDPRTVTSDQYVPRGGLVVESTPPGARVFLDGDFRGLTPFETQRLDAGAYELRLTLEGFLPITESVDVVGGRVTIRQHEMPSRTSLDEYVAPDPARLIITTPERGVTVRVDGRRMGYTPVEVTLAPGRYDLHLENQEGDSWSEEVTLAPGQELRIDAPLQRSLDTRGGPSRETLAWIGIGTGGALLAGGATVGLLAAGDARRYNDRTSDPGRAALRDSARTKSTVADVLLGSGILIGAVGTVLLLTGDRERPSDDPLEQLVLQPWAAPGAAGINLRSRF
ncbi:MAG: PEGA domain-containing protein [Deltaproteobacteria bacterium]|nr:MAG: PEGA domain-containing protein [Deltaproteobacteria bacterium]